MKKITCPSCGNAAMSWAKKLFGFSLKCNSCSEKLRHDFFWSLFTVTAFTLLAYFLIKYIFGPLAVIPILLLASLVIIITPLKRKPQK